MLKLASLLMGFALPTWVTQLPSGTYEAVVNGMSCSQQPSGGAVMECEYRVRKSLHFVITGVGSETAGIDFMASSREGDYYASFGISHGCVIVTPGRELERQAEAQGGRGSGTFVV